MSLDRLGASSPATLTGLHTIYWAGSVNNHTLWQFSRADVVPLERGLSDGTPAEPGRVDCNAFQGCGLIQSAGRLQTSGKPGNQAPLVNLNMVPGKGVVLSVRLAGSPLLEAVLNQITYKYTVITGEVLYHTDRHLSICDRSSRIGVSVPGDALPGARVRCCVADIPVAPSKVYLIHCQPTNHSCFADLARVGE